MPSPLLTIITPTYKRPIGLAMCKASVQGQERAEEIQHLIVVDEVGKGVDGMYRDLPLVHDQIEGAFVFILSDDDVLIYPRVVNLIRDTIDLEIDVIMVKQFYNGHILPAPGCWNAPPACGFVTLSNWIVRREVHTEIPYGARYEGDYDFIRACWDRHLRFGWADVVLSATQQGAGFGRSE